MCHVFVLDIIQILSNKKMANITYNITYYTYYAPERTFVRLVEICHDNIEIEIILKFAMVIFGTTRVYPDVKYLS